MTASELPADEVATTPAGIDCLAALRRITGGEDGPLERHGVRLFVVVERLAAEQGLEIDRELVLCCALLHDVGLYPQASDGGPYVTDGRHYAERVLAPHGWPAERLELCLDAVERHHELRPQWHRGVEVELVRRADLVEVAAGLVRFGLSGGWLRGLFRAVPRDGFYREIGPLLLRVLRERPATLPMIFVAGEGASGAPTGPPRTTA